MKINLAAIGDAEQILNLQKLAYQSEAEIYPDCINLKSGETLLQASKRLCSSENNIKRVDVVEIEPTLHQLAKQYSLILLPFMLDEIILKPQLMQADGLHPNEKAQAIISKNLWQVLEPVLSN